MEILGNLARLVVMKWFSLFLALSLSACGQKESVRFEKMRAAELYATLCASCHGAQFEGGRGGSLVDGQWKHGAGDADLARSIATGFPNLGMTPYDGVLTDKQIRALVILIREEEAEFREGKNKRPDPKKDQVIQTKHHNFQTEVVTSGLELPWAVAFLPDGSFLVTERGGKLRKIAQDGTLNPRAIEGTPKVLAQRQGGLLEVALHPDFQKNGWIYLGLSDPHPSDRNRSLTAVFRGRIQDHRWVGEEVIWKGPRDDYSRSGLHFGTRFVFRDGFIYFPVGERGANMKTQDLGNSYGKFFRLHDDGRFPSREVTFGGEKALPGVWSMGHRNPQGVAIHPETGEIWSTEHGPRGGDELNVIKPGNNYGWPVVTHGMNYNGTPITDLIEKEAMTNPVLHWTPSIAVCGLDFYLGDRFPKWQNDLLVGSLRAQELQRLRLRDGRVIEQETILKNAGRIRDVATGPDGFIYLLKNEPGQLVRLRPVSSE